MVRPGNAPPEVPLDLLMRGAGGQAPTGEWWSCEKPASRGEGGKKIHRRQLPHMDGAIVRIRIHYGTKDTCLPSESGTTLSFLVQRLDHHLFTRYLDIPASHSAGALVSLLCSLGDPDAPSSSNSPLGSRGPLPTATPSIPGRRWRLGGQPIDLLVELEPERAPSNRPPFLMLPCARPAWHKLNGHIGKTTSSFLAITHAVVD